VRTTRSVHFHSEAPAPVAEPLATDHPALATIAGIFNFFSNHILTPSPPAAAATGRLRKSKKGDVLNDCLMTVNGTDFRIPQQGLAMEGNPFGSHKYAGKSALRYELGVSILGGDLPYPAGKFTDIAIFNKVLRNFLDPGERVEADKGYAGHADKIVCPANAGNPPELKAMQGRVRACHETLNGQLILSQVFRHHITLHGTAFWACAVVTQITIPDCDKSLFMAEYSDEFFN
jgi:hypothetical protein